ncbi:9-cis-epoxycarotenoid dioxygenase NCED6 [Hibiscus syriacus]|uniref:9-cis-epoxycarotenoid dioxygenase NCED6 n=1 Tax=Hibiscus syriacus TaxID=106335 RepID=A0A6A2XJ17_HIBSY|nr:9-cis-epoxycarotenoid dioxygenase NCED6 [Hibiscus syriacus]
MQLQPSLPLLQPRSPLFTCKILINPSKKTIPRHPSPSTCPSPLLPRYPEVERSVLVPRELNYPAQLNPFQKLAAVALDKIETSVIMPLEKNHVLPKTVDPTVQISGNFAPVGECPVRQGLEVVGRIPACLHGVYVRNGANPMFAPSGGHHLFDGDGMIHAISLGPGNEASYSCRYTRTSRLVQEARLGRCMFPKPIGELHGHLGLARLGLFMARSGLGLVDGSHGTGVANAGLVYFNGRLLAMSEDDLPYHVNINGDADLETVGQFNFDDQIDCPLIAHPKLDPVTGDLHTLNYNVLKKPYLKYFKFDKFGRKSRDLHVNIEQATMVHDFAITGNFVIIPDHQMVFKLSEMIGGGSPVVYNKKKTSRFGVLRQNDAVGSGIQWIDVPNCFCFHLWNAWEEDNTETGDKTVVVIGRINTKDYHIRDELGSGSSERAIPRSKDPVRLLGHSRSMAEVFRHRKSRFTDRRNHEIHVYRFGGEPFFVPENKQRKGENDEDEGYIMGLVRDEEKETSEMVIVKAGNMKQVGAVRLPTRVPYGFHGTLVSQQDLRRQVM